MGFRISRFLRPVAKIAGLAAATFIPGAAPIVAGIAAATSGLRLPKGSPGLGTIQVAGAVPNLMQGSPMLNFAPSVFQGPMTMGSFQQAAMPAVVAGMMSGAVVGAIIKLARVAGVAITQSNVARVGRRLWASTQSFVRRNPGLSIASFLTSLGLASNEVAEFMVWGSTRRRARRRGLTWADLRRTRRTLRILHSMQHSIGPAVGHRRRAPARRGGSTIIAQN